MELGVLRGPEGFRGCSVGSSGPPGSLLAAASALGLQRHLPQSRTHTRVSIWFLQLDEGQAGEVHGVSVLQLLLAGLGGGQEYSCRWVLCLRAAAQPSPRAGVRAEPGQWSPDLPPAASRLCSFRGFRPQGKGRRLLLRVLGA